MTAPAADGQREHVAAGRHAAGRDVQLPGVVGTPDVDAEIRVRLRKARGQHGLRAQLALLRRLEDDLHPAGQALLPGLQQLRQPQPAGDVRVVAAGVHQSRLLRGVVQPRALRLLQRVGVGAEGHGLSALGPQQGDGDVALGILMRNVHIVQHAPDARVGFKLVPRRLGKAMKKAIGFREKVLFRIRGGSVIHIFLHDGVF